MEAYNSLKGSVRTKVLGHPVYKVFKERRNDENSLEFAVMWEMSLEMKKHKRSKEMKKMFHEDLDALNLKIKNPGALNLKDKEPRCS